MILRNVLCGRQSYIQLFLKLKKERETFMTRFDVRLKCYYGLLSAHEMIARFASRELRMLYKHYSSEPHKEGKSRWSDVVVPPCLIIEAGDPI